MLFEYLELLPRLKTGVVVHIHDIFTPRNYPREWLVEDQRLWNEQYLLEAFLTENSRWEIVGACNWLHAKHFERYKKAAPNVTPQTQPGSFYIRKIR